MQLSRFAPVFVIGLTLTLAAGCRKGPAMTTRIPGAEFGKPKVPVADTSGSLAENTNPIVTENGIPPVSPDAFANYTQHPEILEANTVHFAFDSSVVKTSEAGNVKAVADYMKAHPEDALEIDGHCDERGTAEYNRSLGDRRAIALREELAKLGAPASRIKTTTFGFDRPADTGHNESAWAKNRRGEFIVLTPPEIKQLARNNNGGPDEKARLTKD